MHILRGESSLVHDVVLRYCILTEKSIEKSFNLSTFKICACAILIDSGMICVDDLLRLAATAHVDAV